MNMNLVARAVVSINAPSARVWDALINPQVIKKYMFGADVISDWRVGSSIIWKGEWQGKPYEDKGKILQLKPGQKIQYNHFSPLSGLTDKPENYHTITVELTAAGKQTQVSLTQDNNSNEEERAHSEQNWKMVLDSMKKILES